MKPALREHTLGQDLTPEELARVQNMPHNVLIPARDRRPTCCRPGCNNTAQCCRQGIFMPYSPSIRQDYKKWVKKHDTVCDCTPAKCTKCFCMCVKHANTIDEGETTQTDIDNSSDTDIDDESSDNCNDTMSDASDIAHRHVDRFTGRQTRRVRSSDTNEQDTDTGFDADTSSNDDTDNGTLQHDRLIPRRMERFTGRQLQRVRNSDANERDTDSGSNIDTNNGSDTDTDTATLHDPTEWITVKQMSHEKHDVDDTRESTCTDNVNSSDTGPDTDTGSNTDIDTDTATLHDATEWITVKHVPHGKRSADVTRESAHIDNTNSSNTDIDGATLHTSSERITVKPVPHEKRSANVTRESTHIDNVNSSNTDTNTDTVTCSTDPVNPKCSIIDKTMSNDVKSADEMCKLRRSLSLKLLLAQRDARRFKKSEKTSAPLTTNSVNITNSANVTSSQCIREVRSKKSTDSTINSLVSATLATLGVSVQNNSSMNTSDVELKLTSPPCIMSQANPVKTSTRSTDNSVQPICDNYQPICSPISNTPTQIRATDQPICTPILDALVVNSIRGLTELRNLDPLKQQGGGVLQVGGGLNNPAKRAIIFDSDLDTPPKRNKGGPFKSSRARGKRMSWQRKSHTSSSDSDDTVPLSPANKKKKNPTFNPSLSSPQPSTSHKSSSPHPPPPLVYNASSDETDSEPSLRNHPRLQSGSPKPSNRSAKGSPTPPNLPPHNVQEYYSIDSITTRHVARFHTQGIDLKVRLLPVSAEVLRERGLTFSEHLELTLDHLIRSSLHNIRPGDMIGILLEHPMLESNLWVRFGRYADFTVALLLHSIEKLLDSDKGIDFLSGFSLCITVVEMPQGGVIHKPGGSVFYIKQIEKCDNIIKLPDFGDNTCLAASLIAGQAYLKHFPDLKYRNIKRSRAKMLGKIYALHQLAGVPVGPECGLLEIQRFQEVLPVQLCIYTLEFNAPVVIFLGPPARQFINVLLYQNHFYFAKKLNSILGKEAWCQRCRRAFNNPHTHACTDQCRVCKAIAGYCPQTARPKDCDSCLRTFRGETCYDKHLIPDLETGQSTCDIYKKCKKCFQEIKLPKQNHRCGLAKCAVCAEWVPSDKIHNCFIPIYKIPPKKPNTIYASFDVETFQFDTGELDPRGYPIYELKVNCVVLITTCEHCENLRPYHTPCTVCGERVRPFVGLQACDEFCEHIFKKYGGEKDRNIIFFSHNGSKFDQQFILRYLIDHKVAPEVVMQGEKIIMLKADGLKFLDFFLFFHASLSKVAQAFQLKESKGIFPHRMSSADNMNYVGDFPSKDMYHLERMSTAERQDFDKWYEEEKERVPIFNYTEELERYCTLDVIILHDSVLKFKNLYGEIFPGFNPYLFCTLPSAAIASLRTEKHFKKDTLAHIPYSYQAPARRFSQTALQWLHYLEVTNGIMIQKADSVGGEPQVTIKGSKYFVDGLCETSKTIFQFHGCVYHACRVCFPHNRNEKAIFSNLTLDEAYERTTYLDRKMAASQYKLEVIWECEFRKMVRSDTHVKQIVDSYEFVEGIKPEDSIFGGRVELFRAFLKAETNYKIYYYDFISLYAFVMVYYDYIIGHATVIREFDDLNIDSYFGLIKCQIVPPKSLHLPVLPVKCKGKLFFPLCNTCALEESADCQHSEDERSLSGTWVTEEVKLAVEKGYRIRKIYEVWTFQRNPEFKPFKSYIFSLLKIKQEAEGFPLDCTTEEQKQSYIDNYEKDQGIRLEYNRIKKNAGLRSVAKLCLCAAFGKLIEKSSRPNTKFVTSADEFFAILTDSTKEVSHISFEANDSVARIQYSDKTQFSRQLKHSNVILGSMITSYGRITLYRAMDSLPTDAMAYCDTDSAVFCLRDSVTMPKELTIGTTLGCLTDEIYKQFGSSAYIDRFLGAGAKQYCLLVLFNDQPDRKEYIFKIRGFTLDQSALKHLNPDVLEEMVLGHQIDRTVTVANPNQLVRKKNHVLSVYREKNYKLVFNKRIMLEDYFTVAYGTQFT